MLIKSGADVNAQNRAGETPLHAAAGSHDPDTALVNLLVSNGADVNARDKKGQTPLHHIAFARSWEKLGIANALIRAGADVNARCDDGDTPLDYAMLDAQKDYAKLLRRAAGQVSDPTTDEGTWQKRERAKRAKKPPRAID